MKRPARVDGMRSWCVVAPQIRLLRASGEKISYPVLFVDVFAKRDGRWQMLA